MSIPTRERSSFRHARTELFLNGLTLNRTDSPEDVSTATEVDWYGVGLQKACRVQEDFYPDAGATLPVPWGKQDTSAAGSPTLDYVADAAGGVYRLAFSNTNEAQNLTLYFADQLVIDSTKKPFFHARVKLNSDGAAFTAAESLVIGLASARNATLDDITLNAWFKITGANNNILAETDDGTTDDDDNDTGVDYVDNTYLDLKIDLADLSAIKFYINDACVATLAAAAMTGNLQPFIEIQKDAGTETHAVDIDFVEVAWQR